MTLLATEIDTILARAAQLAAGYLEGHDDREQPVLRFKPPAELADLIDLELPERGKPLDALLDDVKEALHYSARTGHARFFNQLFAGYDPAALLGEWLAALLNTSMYTYEVAPVATLMERGMVDRMCTMAGFTDGEGVLTPGGSLSNLMAVLAARDRYAPDCKEKGLPPGKRLTMFMSAEAHYSLKRAAAVAGLGTRAVVEVATDRLGRMIPEELDKAVERAIEFSGKPFMVAATSGTTVPGAFDPIRPIAAIARKHSMWLHVDASYGGSVLFSERHADLMDGLELADSLSWNPHKLLGVPLACAALLVNEQGRLRKTFGMNADYLFHDGDGAELDLGDHTLQCGRRVDAMKLWLSWKAHGTEGYKHRIEHLFDLAGYFRGQVLEREGFVLAREPQSTNVCFHYVPAALRDLPDGSERNERLGKFTVQLRRRLLEDGRFLINYATLDEVPTLRIVLVNPKVNQADLDALLDEIARVGDELAG